MNHKREFYMWPKRPNPNRKTQGELKMKARFGHGGKSAPIFFNVTFGQARHKGDTAFVFPLAARNYERAVRVPKKNPSVLPKKKRKTPPFIAQIQSSN
jgi:hypothetical protein